jgi:hypothetical protein
MLKILKIVLFIICSLVLSANIYNVLDYLYGYQIIQYYNLTETIPHEKYKALYEIIIEPYSSESYLLGSNYSEDGIHLKKNISLFIDGVYAINSSAEYVNFTIYLKNTNNSISDYVYDYYVHNKAFSAGIYQDIYESDVDWLVINNNNKFMMHINGGYVVNNYYHLTKFMHEIINMPFVYQNIVTYSCIVTIIALIFF